LNVNIAANKGGLPQDTEFSTYKQKRVRSKPSLERGKKMTETDTEFVKNINAALKVMSADGRFHKKIMENACDRFKQADKKIEQLEKKLAEKIKHTPSGTIHEAIECLDAVKNAELQAKIEQLENSNDEDLDIIDGYIALTETQAKKIEQLKKEIEKHRWILVSERLPKEKGYINVANAKLQIPRSWYWTNTNAEADRLKAFYTHWKPIVLPAEEPK